MKTTPSTGHSCSNQLCPFPGRFLPVEGHHRAYSKPRSDCPIAWTVQPLCPYCHSVVELRKEHEAGRFTSRKACQEMARMAFWELRAKSYLDFGPLPPTPMAA